MDFIGWCESVLTAVQEKAHANPQAGIIGVYAEDVV
jgi:hypothetical protein